jgi:hypothetical protein
MQGSVPGWAVSSLRAGSHPRAVVAFAPRYEVDGELTAPDGRRPRIRSVWQVDEGQTAPRLITAYPSETNE